MSTPHRVTLEFEATVGNVATAGARAGWSETWYRGVQETDPDAAISANNLRAQRKKLLTPGWSITAIRVSQLDPASNLLRRGQLLAVTPANQPGLYPGANQDEQPYDAVEISVNSAGGHHRSFSMRGIGQDVISAGGRFLNPPDFAAAFTAWSGFLTGANPLVSAGNWCLRIRTQVVNPGSFGNLWPIVAVDLTNSSGQGTGPRRPLLTVPTITNLVAGQTVVISGANGIVGLNGNWIIDAAVTLMSPIVGSFVILRPKRRTTLSGTYTGGGFFNSYGFSLDNVTNLSAAYGTSRRTGRPLQLIRGRRSNRRSQ